MNVKIYKEDVIEGLQKAANIIPQRTGAAYLRSIWLRTVDNNLEILSTDSSVEFRGSYTAEIIEPGLAGVQGRAFVDLIRRLPAGQISLKLDEKASVLHIEQGRRKYKLPVNDSTWFQNFADFPESGSVMWSGDFFQELLDKIVFCIGDESMDAISCLVMKPAEEDKIEAAGMNGHQFAMLSFSHDELRGMLPEGGILIQKKYLGEIKKWLGVDEININIDEKRLFLRTENKKESLSLPLSSYQYPDYNSFVGRLKAGASTLKVDRSEAQDALMRIAIFNNDSNRCAYFDLGGPEAVISATGQDTGSATESLDVEYTGDVSKIAFPTSNLLSIFEHFSSSNITFAMTGAEGPCGITGTDDANYLVIIMPMKIIEDTQYSEEQV